MGVTLDKPTDLKVAVRNALLRQSAEFGSLTAAQQSTVQDEAAYVAALEDTGVDTTVKWFLLGIIRPLADYADALAALGPRVAWVLCTCGYEKPKGSRCGLPCV